MRSDLFYLWAFWARPLAYGFIGGLMTHLACVYAGWQHYPEWPARAGLFAGYALGYLVSWWQMMDDA